MTFPAQFKAVGRARKMSGCGRAGGGPAVLPRRVFMSSRDKIESRRKIR